MSKTEVTTMAGGEGGSHCGSEGSAWSERHVHPDLSPGPPLVGPKSTTRAAKTFSNLDGSLHPQKGTQKREQLVQVFMVLGLDWTRASDSEGPRYKGPHEVGWGVWGSRAGAHVPGGQ